MKVAIVNFRKLTVVCALLPMAGCANEATGTRTSWLALNLEGSKLELIDNEKVETYSFSQDAIVAVSFGNKNGAIAGPLLYWRIEGDHLLISGAPGQSAVIDFHEPRLNEDILFVKSGISRSLQFRVRKADA